MAEGEVRFTNNGNEEKQGALRAAELIWNGKEGRHISRVSKPTLAKLIQLFGDRVEVEAAEEAPTVGASPSTAVPTVEAPSTVAEPATVPVPAGALEADQAPPAVAPSTAARAVDGRSVAAAEPSPASEPAAAREGFQQAPHASWPRLPLRRPSTT
ncbi:hypothetical protein JQ595_17755 [Bradyrhizobium japonicum]|uniref:hypothetical protein n=1 Tax=Bradyrhizobium japonicum TaxID=375 RepID=UPI001BAD1D6D|nr:hypothetical protein [Bradyrhizobium japonicum]MBR0730590.1 hypothetical protein [Bradyrhizobium japonicum]